MATPVAGRVLLPVIGIGAAAEPETVQLLKLLPKIPVASGAKPPEPMDASTDERARRAGLLAAAAQARAGGILQSATKSNPTSSTAARGPSPPPQDDALLITRAGSVKGFQIPVASLHLAYFLQLKSFSGCAALH